MNVIHWHYRRTTIRMSWTYIQCRLCVSLICFFVVVSHCLDHVHTLELAMITHYFFVSFTNIAIRSALISFLPFFLESTACGDLKNIVSVETNPGNMIVLVNLIYLIIFTNKDVQFMGLIRQISLIVPCQHNFYYYSTKTPQGLFIVNIN